MNRKSDLLLVNCNDRVIRLYRVAEYDSLNPAQKLTEEQCRARLDKKSVSHRFSPISILFGLMNEFHGLAQTGLFCKERMKQHLMSLISLNMSMQI